MPPTSDTLSVLLPLSRIADGALVEAEGLVDGVHESLVLHRRGDAVRGWLNICPHAGRRLDWAPGQFLVSKDGLLVCAAHGAAFDLADGACVAGPCRGQSLAAVDVAIEGDAVVLRGAAAPG